MNDRHHLAIRWFVGLVLMLAVRLLFERWLPPGAATGFGFAAFMLLWIPTVPASAYRRESPDRKVLYTRIALFWLAAIVSGLLFSLIAPHAPWLQRA